MKISSGRAPKLAPKNTKHKRNISGLRICAADITALVCALMCAVCLISWSASDSREERALAVFAEVSQTASSEAEREKGFWDHFSEAVANAFGYSG